MAPFRDRQPDDPFELIFNRLRILEEDVRTLENNRAPTVPFYDSNSFPAQAIEGQLVIAGPIELVADIVYAGDFDGTPGVVGFTSAGARTSNLARLLTVPGGGQVLVFPSIYDPTTVLIWIDDGTTLNMWRVNRDGTNPIQVIDTLVFSSLHANMQPWVLDNWYETTTGAVHYWDMASVSGTLWLTSNPGMGGSATNVVSTADLHSDFVGHSDTAFTTIKVNNAKTRLVSLVTRAGANPRYHAANISTGAVVDLGLSTAALVGGGPGVYGNIAWSPNNVDLAYDWMTVASTGTPKSIKKIDTVTASASTIYTDSASGARVSDPYYSNSGDEVMFQHKPDASTDRNVGVMNADGTGSPTFYTGLVLDSTGLFADFSPNDQRIVVAMRQGIGYKIIERAGPTITDLSTDSDNSYVYWLA